ncbi:MAG: ABC transporter permease subunit [Eubacteriales bacterium]|nr:ABC transporter permease subunit [Eubacteriales bacterium]
MFFLKGIIEQSIPASLLEAGRLEGCSELTLFHRLILPGILPGVCSMCIFNFVSSWNNDLTPLILLNQNTMPVMAAMIKGLYRSDYGAMYLSVSMSVLPFWVVYVFFSRFIINGITSGSFK